MRSLDPSSRRRPSQKQAHTLAAWASPRCPEDALASPLPAEGGIRCPRRLRRQPRRTPAPAPRARRLPVPRLAASFPPLPLAVPSLSFLSPLCARFSLRSGFPPPRRSPHLPWPLPSSGARRGRSSPPSPPRLSPALLLFPRDFCRQLAGLLCGEEEREASKSGFQPRLIFFLLFFSLFDFFNSGARKTSVVVRVHPSVRPSWVARPRYRATIFIIRYVAFEKI